MKIYVGGISTETNSFSPINMDIEQFKKGFWLLGEDIRKVKSTTKETRGTLDYLDAQDDVEIAYGFVAHGVTSGPLKSSDYHFMSDLLIQTLEDAMPVDGVVLNMHGAMQSEDCFDCEGNVFVRIRKIVGSNVPIVSSFDLHACITPEMVSSLDGIASFRTYPHTDHADAGFRAAETCVHLAREKIQPGKLLFSLPMIMPVENCNTGEGPIVPIMAMTDRLLADQDVISGSLNLTQPWLDVPDLGCQLSVFLTPEADVERIKDEMHSILHKLWEDRDKFNVYVPSIEESLEACTTLAPPVCLVELGDIVSAGGVGDSTIALRALLKSKSLRPACLTVMDKNTVAQALTIGLKKRGVFSIGSDVDHGYNTRTPVHATVMNFNSDRVAPVGNTESGVLYDMGMRVLLKTDDDMYIIVNEYPSYNHDQAMVTSMGIDPRSFKVIVQKTHQMFKEGYRGIMGSFIYADTEGFTDRNLKRLPYKNARRPLYPLDDCVYTTIIHA